MRGFRINRQSALCTLVATAVGIVTLFPARQTFAASEPKPKKPELPSASTGGARAHGSGVELAGSINPKGEATNWYFQYGPTVAYGSQTPTATVPAGTTTVKVTQLVTGLQPGYHYRLVTSNSRGTTDGHDHTYTLPTPKTKKPATKKPTTKPERLKVTLSSPPPEGLPVGSPVTIAGALTGTDNIDHQVILQATPYPYSAAYATLGSPQMTSSTGRFTFRVARLNQNTRYRVLVPGALDLFSQPITELATVHVTFHARSAPHSGLVRLYGSVTPAAPTGAAVLFQLQRIPKRPRLQVFKSEKAEERAEQRAETPVFATTFSAPIEHATKTASRFSSVVSIRKGGLYRAYVAVPRGPLASGFSTGLTLRASAQKKNRKRKKS
jgi:hypothetical protein